MEPTPLSLHKQILKKPEQDLNGSLSFKLNGWICMPGNVGVEQDDIDECPSSGDRIEETSGVFIPWYKGEANILYLLSVKNV